MWLTRIRVSHKIFAGGGSDPLYTSKVALCGRGLLIPSGTAPISGEDAMSCREYLQSFLTAADHAQQILEHRVKAADILVTFVEATHVVFDLAQAVTALEIYTGVLNIFGSFKAFNLRHIRKTVGYKCKP